MPQTEERQTRRERLARINVCLPLSLLAQLDEETAARGSNVSTLVREFIAEGLKAKSQQEP